MNARLPRAAVVLLAAGLALGLRTWQLDSRPMHGDEAVHAAKLNELLTTGQYAYDPEEFHGPTLYYFTLPAAWLSGAHDWTQLDAATLRIVPALFGVGLILLLLLVADGIGTTAAVVAAFLAATSPALVFYSRYYVQETLLAFFAFGLIAAGWRYVQTRRIVWAVLAGACAGLMHATKETCVIAFACMAAALVVTRLWPERELQRQEASPETRVPRFRSGSDRRNTARRWGVVVAGVVIALLTSALLYSGFLTNARGPIDAWRTYAVWGQRAAATHVHDHPWYYYLKLLGFTHYPGAPAWSEAPLLALAAVGIVTILLRRGIDDVRVRLLRFLLVYSVLMTAAYSAIPYKTPWCAVQFVQPLTVLVGVGAAALWDGLKSLPVRAIAATTLLVTVAWSIRQSLAADGRYCADQRNPYVYAHPVRDVERLSAWVEKLAAVSPAGHDLLIRVIAPNPWPLPWYLRRFPHIGYWEQPPADCDAPVLIVAVELQEAIASRLHDQYDVAYYGLRPGETLLVYAQQSLYDAFVARQAPPASASSETQP